MDQEVIGLEFTDHFADALENRGRDMGEALIGAHDVEVVMRVDLEEIEHRIQHRAMLAGDADAGVDAFAAGELADQRAPS